MAAVVFMIYLGAVAALGLVMSMFDREDIVPRLVGLGLLLFALAVYAV